MHHPARSWSAAWLTAIFGFVFLVSLGQPPAATADEPAPRLRLGEGDCVVWLGATFAERLQAHGYLETLLTAAHPAQQIRFRNLGWSGDEVSGVSRAVFGDQQVGFTRLAADLKLAAPTVVLVQYGAVEAEQGVAGLERFAAGLNRVLDVADEVNARAAVVTPAYRTRPTAALPDPAPYNASLDAYCAVMKAVAATRKLPLIDLREILDGVDTPNGLHPSQQGSWQMAPRLAAALGVPSRSWEVRLDLATKSYDAVNTAVDGLTWEQGVRFGATDRYLCDVAPPVGPGPGAGRLQVAGLAPGDYRLSINKREVVTASARQWAQGLTLPRRGGDLQAEQLRQAILAKDTLFFHRHRPQNETYLFLFRKHEQGNNAVEIPQFDKLIAGQEGRIAELRRPRRYMYQLSRVE